MRKFLTALIAIPIGLILIVFAVANRHLVTVSFDPLNSVDPADGVRVPLFVLIIGTAILGVIAGGIATWIRQSRWRRAARRHQADAIEARAQLAQLRAGIANPAGRDALQVPLLPGQGVAASERDKYGATL